MHIMHIIIYAFDIVANEAAYYIVKSIKPNAYRPKYLLSR